MVILVGTVGLVVIVLGILYFGLYVLISDMFLDGCFLCLGVELWDCWMDFSFSKIFGLIVELGTYCLGV